MLPLEKEQLRSPLQGLVGGGVIVVVPSSVHTSTAQVMLDLLLGPLLETAALIVGSDVSLTPVVPGL